MMDTVLARLIWKEYRVQRSFWVSVAVMAFAGQVIASWLLPIDRYRPDWLFAMALTFPALFALGSAASLFAGEREDGTIEQLRILAMPPGQVLVSKLGFAAVATGGMLAILWAFAALLARGEFPRGDIYLSLWVVSGIACIEALAWGMFFSLLVQRGLIAAVLASAAICLSFVLTRLIVFVYEAPIFEPPPVQFATATQILTPAFVTARVVLAALVLLIGIAIARAWVLEPSRTARTRAISAGSPSSRLSPLGRLVWQEGRQARRTILVVMGIALLLALLSHLPNRLDGFDPGMAAFFMAIIASVMGSCVFLSEQERRRFRFFADQGIPAGLVWWGKHVVWMPATLAVLATVLLVTIGLYPPRSWMPLTAQETIHRFRYIIAYPIFGYCAGQFFSMLIPRGIIAGFFSLILTLLLADWLGLMAWLHVALWWSVWSIPVVLLIATRVRVSDWLLERNTARAWGRFAAVLGLPLVALLAGIATCRAREIRAMEHDFRPFEIFRPASQERNRTADVYSKGQVMTERTWKK